MEPEISSTEFDDRLSQYLNDMVSTTVLVSYLLEYAYEQMSDIFGDTIV